MAGDVTIPLLPCAAVDDVVERPSPRACGRGTAGCRCRAIPRTTRDDARAEAVLAELLALPLTDAERDALADLLPGGDARGLGAEQ